MRFRVPEIISRANAVRQGLNWYFTGKPCKSGHLAKRRTDSYHCTECAVLATVAWNEKDIPRRRENQKVFRDRSPTRIQDYRLRGKYGIGIEDRDRMFDLQGKCCAVCRSDDPGTYGRWNIDHCHATGNVRGILCQACNLALGFARDSVPVLKNMIEYLEQHAASADEAKAA